MLVYLHFTMSLGRKLMYHDKQQTYSLMLLQMYQTEVTLQCSIRMFALSIVLTTFCHKQFKNFKHSG